MIINGSELPAAGFTKPDVCIVGGGPAGIALALRLERAGLSAVLLESGGLRESEASRDLNRGWASPIGSHEPLEENRRRQWGGASAVWGGRCIPFDEIDFVERSWVPNSGWPVAKSVIDPYYDEAVTLCEAGNSGFDARSALPHTHDLLPGIDGDGISTFPIERWSRPTHFGKRYRRQLAAATGVTVVLNATCTHVQLLPRGDAVDHVIVTTSKGDRRLVRARAYVVAAGGLENARILLSSDDVAAGGIGNHSGCLGRYYQTHLFGCHARLVLAGDGPPAHVGFDRDADGVYCRRRIWIDGERQESEQILNTVFFPVRPPTGSTGHRSALFSGVYLVKTFAAVARRPSNAAKFLRSESSAVRSHTQVFVRHFPEAVPELFRAFLGRYVGSRRLPAILPADGLRAYHLQFQAEQVPNAQARVYLSQDRDALGMRRLVAAPRATNQDIESVVRAHQLLDQRLRATGIGVLDFDDDKLRAAVTRSTARVNSAAHHLGTTRMATDPADGVVDSNCRVHGVANLYVAGGSVMPTSGHANPTLTIVALALRLGDRLQHDLRSPE